MKNIKFKLFIARYIGWIIGIISIIAFGLLIFMFCRFNIIKKISQWEGETIAVVGTLLGAIIGGVFTLLGSIYINKKQLKAQTQIKKKNLIYKPLYDELSQIENNILSSNPFPHIVSLNNNEEGWRLCPQYTVWNRIKSDTRYLETPKELVCEYEKLIDKVQQYLRAREKDNEEMTLLINSILQNVIGAESSIINIGDCLMRDALTDSGNNIYHFYEHSLKGIGEIKQEQIQEINDRFYAACKTNHMVLTIKKAKEEWDIQQKKVLELLTNLIQYVNIKYED